MKKAEEILNSKPSIDWQMNDLLFEYADLIEAMQEYAKDQIQKDRVDAANNFQPRCITQDGQLKQMQSIVNRPIILD